MAIEIPATLCVLLAEDNDDDVETVTRVLRRSGLEIRLEVARDGEEALSKLAQEARRCAKRAGPRRESLVLLLDVDLPRVDGVEILRRLRAEPSLTRLPVVVLTGSFDGVRRCLDLDANMYLLKPLNAADVMNIVIGTQKFWPDVQPDEQSQGAIDARAA